jgi:CheY-like chemotaxis protein
LAEFHVAELIRVMKHDKQCRFNKEGGGGFSLSGNEEKEMIMKGGAMASILIADDQKQIRRLVSKALSSDGHHVTTVDDICGAWEQIGECRPDMVLLNCLSEDFDSFEFLIDIKCRHPDYPVLVYTVTNHEAIDNLKETISDVLNEGQPKDGNRKSLRGFCR